MYWSQRRLLFREFLIEIARVGAAILLKKSKRQAANRGKKPDNSRVIRRCYAFVEHIVPVYVFEKWLSLDFFRIGFSRTQSSVWISGKELEYLNQFTT